MTIVIGLNDLLLGQNRLFYDASNDILFVIIKFESIERHPCWLLKENAIEYNWLPYLFEYYNTQV